MEMRLFRTRGFFQEEENQGYPGIGLKAEHLPHIEIGHHKAVTHEDQCSQEAGHGPHLEGSGKGVHENPGKNEVDKECITMGPFGKNNEKKEIKGIEYCRFKMSQERHPSKKIRIPVGYGIVELHLLIKKLLEAEVERHKVRSKKKMASENDISEQKEAEKNN
jgi:hypothetical protein